MNSLTSRILQETRVNGKIIDQYGVLLMSDAVHDGDLNQPADKHCSFHLCSCF